MNAKRAIQSTIESLRQATRGRLLLLALAMCAGILGSTGCTNGHGQHARLHQYRTMAPAQAPAPGTLSTMASAG